MIPLTPAIRPWVMSIVVAARPMKIPPIIAGKGVKFSI
jgi:hypothetical protein